MSFDDLERRVHDELRRLPAPLAPGTLLPRVLAAVDAWARRPWYARAWFTWPIGLRVASVAALVAAAYGMWNLPPLPEPVLATTSAGSVIWRTLIEPLLGYVVGLVVLMCLACALFGAALNYLFLERTASR
jgi:hypothetical protein